MSYKIHFTINWAGTFYAPALLLLIIFILKHSTGFLCPAVLGHILSVKLRLTGLQKAAILLIALGPERSAGVFKHLKEEEIEVI